LHSFLVSFISVKQQPEYGKQSHGADGHKVFLAFRKRHEIMQYVHNCSSACSVGACPLLVLNRRFRSRDARLLARQLLDLDVTPRRGILVIAAIVVATRALRYSAVAQLLMAITAVKLTVELVQLKAGYSVPEIRLIPTAVAIDTLGTQFADGLSGRMTGPAL